MQLFIDTSIVISAEFEVLREKTAELKKLNEQLRDEVDDLHVKYSDMQSSLDKETTQRKEDRSVFLTFVCLFCCFTSQVNSYGHCWTVSSPNHTFSWASLNKRVTSNSCTYFRL